MAYSDRIVQGFRDDARQLIAGINDNLVRLEKSPEDPELVNEIFRHAHSLKDSAALMGFDTLAETAHRIEDLFSLLKNGRLRPAPEIVSFLLEGTNLLESLLETHLAGETPRKEEASRFHERITSWLPSTGSEPAPAVVVSDTNPSTAPALLLTNFEKEIVAAEIGRDQSVFLVTIRLQPEVSLRYARAFLAYTNLQTISRIIKTVPDINLSGNDALFETFHILLSTGSAPREIEKNIGDSEVRSVEVRLWEEPRTAETTTRPIHLETGIRISPEDLNAILDLVSELTILRNEMSTLKDPVTESLTDSLLTDRFSEAVLRLETLAAGLQERFMKVRMVPIEQIFRPFTRYVRETAGRLGKEIELETSGTETLLDRSVMESLIVPLSHIIRNAVSHGIETRIERTARAKPPAGRITLSAAQTGNSVVLEIADDGRGLDPEAIRSAAVRKGLLPAKAPLAEKNILDLICKPGFSTERVTTDLSGRGIGMDVVRTAVEKLQGSLELVTKKNEGAKFVLTLPLSLALIKTLLAVSGRSVLAIPLNFVEKTFVIPTAELRGRSFPLERDGLTLLSLDALWSGKPAALSGDFSSCVLLSSRERRLGLVASTLLREEDLVLKETDPLFSRHPLIAGGSILGDGRVVFLLNALKIFEKAET